MTLPLDITPFFSGSTLSYSANGLPAGLVLNGSTGLITGNPTTPGISAVTVTATNAAGSAQQNFQWTISAAASVPSQVAGLVATPGDGQISLSWLEPNNNGATISDYVIERQIGGGGFVTLNDGAGTGLSFVDVGLSNDVLHEYRVSAVNSVGTGVASLIASATPTSAATVPGQVVGLAAVPGDGQISLSWTAPNDNGSAITDYQIERQIAGGGFAALNDGVGTDLNFTDTALTNDTLHEYRVSAINAQGIGPASTLVAATPTAPAAGGAEIVTRDSGVDGGSASVYTFPGIAIGTGDVIVSTLHRNGAVATSATLDGNAMTLIGSDTSGGQGISFWRLDGQSSGTAEIVVSLQTGASRCGIGVWTVTGAGTALSGFDLTPASGSTSVDIAAQEGGLLLAYGSTVKSGTPPTMTFSNVDPVDLGGGLFVEELGPSESFYHALADRETTAAQTETVSLSSQGSLQMFGVVAIGPG